MSWVKQKATPNLKDAKADTIVARPSLQDGREEEECDVTISTHRSRTSRIS